METFIALHVTSKCFKHHLRAGFDPHFRGGIIHRLAYLVRIKAFPFALVVCSS